MFFGDFISKNIGLFRESSCSTKKSYGIEILSVYFSSLCVSKDRLYMTGKMIMCYVTIYTVYMAT